MAAQIIARNGDTSIALDLLRALAAQVVAVVHVLALFDLPHPAISFGAVAVLVFFVMSGFVIAHALMRAESFSSYAIDRTARIYSAYLPAVLFVLVADSLMVWAGIYGEPKTVEATVGHALHVLTLQDSTVFGTGFTFWTLAIEFQMYLFVGALFFLKSSRHWIALLVVAVLFAKLPVEQLGARGLFTLWLMGFGAYFVIKAGVLSKIPLPALGFIALASALYWFHEIAPGTEYNPALYGWFGLAFVALVGVTQRTSVLARLGGAARFFAGYSFSLYLTHYTITYAAAKLWSGPYAAGLTLIAANVFAFGFAYVTERHYKKIAGWIKSAGLWLMPGSLARG